MLLPNSFGVKSLHISVSEIKSWGISVEKFPKVPNNNLNISILAV